MAQTEVLNSPPIEAEVSLPGQIVGDAIEHNGDDTHAVLKEVSARTASLTLRERFNALHELAANGGTEMTPADIRLLKRHLLMDAVARTAGARSVRRVVRSRY